MTDFAQEYQNLSRRRETIVSQIAVRRADEERKKKEREEIEAELREAGIDPTKPDEEIARLTKELEEGRNRLSKELDELENQLKLKVSPPEPGSKNLVDAVKDLQVLGHQPDILEEPVQLDLPTPSSDADDILIS